MSFNTYLKVALFALLASGSAIQSANAALPGGAAIGTFNKLAEKTTFSVKISPLLMPYQLCQLVYNYPVQTVIAGTILAGWSAIIIEKIRKYYDKKISAISTTKRSVVGENGSTTITYEFNEQLKSDFFSIPPMSWFKKQ